ncbi:MAG TPA: VOC family protein [Actinomycetota bacterium]|jgi:predicted enzyme related to lactoylglutathione lyase
MDPPSVVERLDLVFYWVTDMERAVSFYRDVLGLKLLRQESATWAEFDAGGRRFALHSAGDGQPVGGGAGATAVFAVGDLNQAKSELSARGVQFTHEGDVEGYARFASFLDPEGNPVQLIEYSGGPGG